MLTSDGITHISQTSSSAASKASTAN